MTIKVVKKGLTRKVVMHIIKMKMTIKVVKKTRKMVMRKTCRYITI